MMAAAGLPPGRRPLSGAERRQTAAVGGATAAAYPGKEAADPTPPSLDLAIPWLDPAGGCVVGGGRGRGAAAHQGRQHRRDEAVATVRRWQRRRRRRRAGDDACTAAGGGCRGEEMRASDSGSTTAMAARGSTVAVPVAAVAVARGSRGNTCGDSGGG